MKLPELLAPAGNLDCLEAVFNHGADAAYIGIGPFNLRAQSPNFTINEIPEVIAFTHDRKKRVYAVFNSMPTDIQLGVIESFFQSLSHQGCLPDAVIVSDPGVLSLCKEYLGGCAIHLSTQTGTFNVRAMQFWATQGISRVVLPRELDLEQIAFINRSGIGETEIFIHGAMCVSISGRCLLGAYLSGRHPNQGDCPQPCRYQYAIAPLPNDTSDAPQWFSAEENEQGVYLMNSKDLNTLSILPQIIATGVASLKIEGRNKSVHYVSSVVKTYRKALDLLAEDPQAYTPDPAWFDELEKLDHRPYTTGFYGNDYQIQSPYISKAESRIRVVGIVKAIVEGGHGVVDVKNPFLPGEDLEILPVNNKKAPYAIKFFSITDVSGNPMERAITNRIVIAMSEMKLVVGDIIRREIDQQRG